MIHLHAYAKVNLDLRIIGKRHDGYHEIQSLMQTIDLGDGLEIGLSRTPGIRLRCLGLQKVPADSENLAYRAAEALLSRTAAAHTGVTLTLRKRIPLGAGLGGGSSDSAAVLRGLNKLLRLRFSDNALAEIASTIGSDVPFFLHGGLCAAFGRGAIVKALHANRRVPILLVTPHLHVSTVDAYGWYARSWAGTTSSPVQTASHYARAIEASYKKGSWASMRNDLEPEVFAHHPQLSIIKAALYDSGALHAQMTGSGSCIYGIFGNSQLLAKASREIARLGHTTIMSRLISRAVALRLNPQKTTPSSEN